MLLLVSSSSLCRSPALRLPPYAGIICLPVICKFLADGHLVLFCISLLPSTALAIKKKKKLLNKCVKLAPNYSNPVSFRLSTMHTLHLLPCTWDVKVKNGDKLGLSFPLLRFQLIKYVNFSTCGSQSKPEGPKIEERGTQVQSFLNMQTPRPWPQRLQFTQWGRSSGLNSYEELQKVLMVHTAKNTGLDTRRFWPWSDYRTLNAEYLQAS